MKIAYLDCSSGISGDMCLGALVDAGVHIKKLENELKKIPIKGYRLRSKEVKRLGFRATKVDVVQKSEVRSQKSEAKRWNDIERIIKKSSLSNKVKQKGISIFRRLFEAEARVHGERSDEVHLHELGAIDCIVDIFGTIIGLELLRIEHVYSSPVNVGGGSVKTEHGILPVPTPATIEILSCQSPVRCQLYSDGTNFELTTPTGAAILKAISTGFESIPNMAVEKIGIGAGAKDLKNKPNILRLFLGESLVSSHQPSASAVTVIETNIDDMNPQIYEHLMKCLFKAGALDVFLTQVIMKKGRPGILLTVLCRDKEREDLIKIILAETTSIGVRFYKAQREILQRESKEFRTEFGEVRFKLSKSGDKTIRITPEYEDCKKLARKLNKPLIDVIKKISYQHRT